MKTIGIIGDREKAWNENYYAAVECCGAKTAPLALREGSGAVCVMDGIILPGGADLNPLLYHEENTESRTPDDALDRFELAVLAEAVRERIPVLGICRGHQLINVFFGGSLIQHVPHAALHDFTEQKKDRVHPVRSARPSFLYEIYRDEKINVNSAHHQAVKVLGKGLREAQRSDDGIIEALCHEHLPVYGVQWHPERMCLRHARPDTADGQKLFAWFVTEIVTAGRY